MSTTSEEEEAMATTTSEEAIPTISEEGFPKIWTFCPGMPKFKERNCRKRSEVWDYMYELMEPVEKKLTCVQFVFGAFCKTKITKVKTSNGENICSARHIKINRTRQTLHPTIFTNAMTKTRKKIGFTPFEMVDVGRS